MMSLPSEARTPAGSMDGSTRAYNQPKINSPPPTPPGLGKRACTAMPMGTSRKCRARDGMASSAGFWKIWAVK